MGKRVLYLLLAVLSVYSVSTVNAQQPSIYRISRMPFNANGFSNISPVIVKDGILFCSNRRISGIKDRTGFDGRRLYNIYLAEKIDTSDFRRPKAIKSERTNKFNNGPLCVAPDGKTIYFTSEIETGKITESKNFKNHSGIFVAQLSGEDLINPVPFKYNDPQFNTGQPSMSRDGKYLFFSSDKPGGSGKSDLYYCTFLNGAWSEPVNMGPGVNSPQAENYPYSHPSGKLYFTSDRPGGIGKLDVYYTTLTNGLWDAPVLLPEPINSRDDDFALVAEADMQSGYFSSNRRREDDIYKFTSTIIRKTSCDTLIENNYCYRFLEENALKYDTMPFRFDWTFSDGTKDTGRIVVHCFKSVGVYTVQLDVYNLVTKEITYNEKTETVEVSDEIQPYISVPDTIRVNQKTSLSADNTNLPGWKINRYYWNFGDESVEVGTNVSKSYLKPGIYNIQLIVTADPEPGEAARETCVSKNIVVLPAP